MRFQVIKDPDNLLSELQENSEKWKQIVQDLTAGRDTILKAKRAKGNIFGIKLNRGDRVVVASYKKQLICLGVFEKAHDTYENFLKTAYGTYAQWVDSGHINEGKSIPLGEPVDQAAAASQSDIEIHQYQPYFNSAIKLTDEQNSAVEANLPCAVLGPAGSGKTVSAIMMLEKLLAEHNPQTAPIVYVGPKALVRRLRRQWNESTLENKDQVKFLSIEELLTQHMPQEGGYTLTGDDDFLTWFESQQTAFKAKIKGQKLTPPDAKTIHREFLIIASLETPDEYVSTEKSLIDGTIKAVILELYYNYLGELQAKQQINSLYTKSLQPINPGFCSALVIDEIQQWSLPMLSWLGKSHVPIAALGDPHQCTIDPRLDNIRRLRNFIKGIQFHELNSTLRNPPAVAAAANILLKVKQQMVGTILKSKVTDFKSLRTEANGTCVWRDHTKGKVEDNLSPIANDPDTAFVVFSKADKNYVKDTYGTELVFFPEDIVGLEFENIVIFKPEHCLGGIENTYWDIHDTKKTRTKDKDDIYRHQEQILNINKLFVAITRALTNVYFITEPLEDKSIRQFRAACESFSGPEQAPSPVKKERTEKTLKGEWLQTIETLITSESAENLITARTLWNKYSLGNSEEFENLKNLLLSDSSPEPSPPAVEKIPAAVEQPKANDANDQYKFLKNFKPTKPKFERLLEEEDWQSYIHNVCIDKNRSAIFKLIEKQKLFSLVKRLSEENQQKLFKYPRFWAVVTEILQDIDHDKKMKELEELNDLIDKSKMLNDEIIVNAMCEPVTNDATAKYAGLTIFYHLAENSCNSVCDQISENIDILNNERLLTAFSLLRPDTCDMGGACVWSHFLKNNESKDPVCSWICELGMKLIDHPVVLVAFNATRTSQRHPDYGLCVWHQLFEYARKEPNHLSMIMEICIELLKRDDNSKIIKAFSTLLTRCPINVWILISTEGISAELLIDLLLEKPTILTEHPEAQIAFNTPIKESESCAVSESNVWSLIAREDAYAHKLLRFLLNNLTLLDKIDTCRALKTKNITMKGFAGDERISVLERLLQLNSKEATTLDDKVSQILNRQVYVCKYKGKFIKNISIIDKKLKLKNKKPTYYNDYKKLLASSIEKLLGNPRWESYLFDVNAKPYKKVDLNDGPLMVILSRDYGSLFLSALKNTDNDLRVKLFKYPLFWRTMTLTISCSLKETKEILTTELLELVDELNLVENDDIAAAMCATIGDGYDVEPGLTIWQKLSHGTTTSGRRLSHIALGTNPKLLTDPKFRGTFYQLFKSAKDNKDPDVSILLSFTQSAEEAKALVQFFSKAPKFITDNEVRTALNTRILSSKPEDKKLNGTNCWQSITAHEDACVLLMKLIQSHPEILLNSSDTVSAFCSLPDSPNHDSALINIIKFDKSCEALISFIFDNPNFLTQHPQVITTLSKLSPDGKVNGWNSIVNRRESAFSFAHVLCNNAEFLLNDATFVDATTTSFTHDSGGTYNFFTKIATFEDTQPLIIRFIRENYKLIVGHKKLLSALNLDKRLGQQVLKQLASSAEELMIFFAEHPQIILNNTCVIEALCREFNEGDSTTSIVEKFTKYSRSRFLLMQFIADHPELILENKIIRRFFRNQNAYNHSIWTSFAFDKETAPLLMQFISHNPKFLSNKDDIAVFCDLRKDKSPEHYSKSILQRLAEPDTALALAQLFRDNPDILRKNKCAREAMSLHNYRSACGWKLLASNPEVNPLLWQILNVNPELFDPISFTNLVEDNISDVKTSICMGLVKTKESAKSFLKFMQTYYDKCFQYYNFTLALTEPLPQNGIFPENSCVLSLFACHDDDGLTRQLAAFLCKHSKLLEDHRIHKALTAVINPENTNYCSNWENQKCRLIDKLIEVDFVRGTRILNKLCGGNYVAEFGLFGRYHEKDRPGNDICHSNLPGVLL